MRLNRRSFLAVLLAGIMVLSLGACGAGKDDAEDKTSEETTSVESTTEEAPQVTLPENFDNMNFPILALLVQENAKGYEYYSQDQEDAEPDSFFYSMAVLTSLMETQSPYGDGIEDDSHYIITENTADMYASALYSQYAEGNMEFPEIPDDDKYASRDDETGDLEFIKGNVDDVIVIKSCEEQGQDYSLTVDLTGAGEDDLKGTYTVVITRNGFEGEDNHFYYSVKSVLTEAQYDFSGDDENAPETDSEQAEESDTQTEASDEEEAGDPDSEEYDPSIDDEETADEYESGDGEEISREEAQELASEYYGSDATYNGMVTIGNDEYYDFTVSDGDTPDVLVSKDGENVMGATKNEDDDTWSFDQ